MSRANLQALEIADGVAGAVRVCAALLAKDPERWPHIYRGLKEHKLTGGRLWLAFKDVCGEQYHELMRRVLDEPHVLQREVDELEARSAV